MNETGIELDKIAEAINKLGMGWSLCFIGEDQASKLGTLTEDLRRGVSEIGDGKQIASGFSYWGIGPTIAWIIACTDRLYPVMNESTKHFSNLWKETFHHIDPQKYHYVSLGVGTGEKDNLMLKSLYKMNKELYYFPVDMSPEMLRIGTREAIDGTPIKRSKILPVQIDFSSEENVNELRELLDKILGNEPILFSLLGNTLSNFADDTDLLDTISRLIKPQDRLLLEVAFTDSLSEEAQKEAAAEYDKSRMFKEFVSSSLLQNTDICVDIDSVSFLGLKERDRSILVKTLYRNKTGKTLNITLPDRTKIDFPENDTIRLSTMRKYTDKGIDELIGCCGFSTLSRLKINFPSRHRQFKFGTELLLLSPSSVKKGKTEDYVWDIFLAHAGADKHIAEDIYNLLNPRYKVFLDSKCLILGDDWDVELSLAQHRSLVSVILVSSNSEQAYYQRDEIAAAIALSRKDKDKHRVVPVFLDDMAKNNAPYGLRLKHGINVSPEISIIDVVEQLIELLNRLR